MTPQSFGEIISAVNAGGTIVLALLFLILFWRGDIISSKTLEKILAEVSARTIASVERLLSEYRSEVRDALDKREGDDRVKRML